MRQLIILRVFCCFLLILREFSQCLKIKLEPRDLLNRLKHKNRAGIEEIINSLLSFGPYNLLSELLLLQSDHIQSLFVSRCYFMTSRNVVDIVRDFDRGEISYTELGFLLSADCMSRWTSFVFDDLDELGLIHRLPRNPFESRDFVVHRIKPRVFLYFLASAWNSDKRENIFWSKWTGKMLAACTDDYYSVLNAERDHLKVWQSMNFRNFAFIKETGIKGRTRFIRFIGLSGVSLEEVGLLELVQRVISLLSILSVLNREYCDSPDYSSKNRAHKLNFENVICVLRIHNAIKELDGQVAEDLKALIDFALGTSKKDLTSEEYSSLLNTIFTSSFRYYQGIELGDWMLSVIVIFTVDLSLIELKNLILFLDHFFSARPSLDSIVFLMKLFKENGVNLENLFVKHLIEKPDHLRELYRKHRKDLSSVLLSLVPLEQRVISNARNPKVVIFTELNINQFPFLENSKLVPFRKLIEMIQVIGLQKTALKINKLEFETYFNLFIHHASSFFFHQINGFNDGQRPIIRLLPIFPTVLWEQFGFLISLSFTLNRKLPFIFDFEFFSAVFNHEERPNLFDKMTKDIKKHSETSEKVKALYSYALTSSQIAQNNIRESLTEIYLLVEKARLDSKTPVRFKHISLSSLANILCPINSYTNYDQYLHFGLNSLLYGIRSGISVDEFSVEELYKLIFY